MNVFLIVVTTRTDCTGFCKKKSKLTMWWDLEQKIGIFILKKGYARAIKVI